MWTVKQVGFCLLTGACLSLAACGGGGGGGSTGGGSSGPTLNSGSTSSSVVPLSPLSPVLANGASGLSALGGTTSFPTISATVAGAVTSGTTSLTVPVVDTTGANTQITIVPAGATTVSSMYGGTTYTDSYDAGGAQRFDNSFTFRELAVTGLPGAYSDLVLYDPTTVSDALQYSSFGWWDRDIAANSGTTVASTFSYGLQTPVGSMPTSGTASYTGKTTGVAVYQGGNGGYILSGSFTATADFAANTLDAAFTNISATNVVTGTVYDSFTNFSAAATISGNTFSGTTASTATNPVLVTAGPYSGTIDGAFYGPSAQEIGGVWTLTTNGGAGWSATGSFGGKQ